MKNLRVSVLMIMVMTSAFGFAELVRPVESSTIGMHLIKVNFYKAYIYNDHDLDPFGPGEWYFYLRSPNSSWAGTPQIVRGGPGFSYFNLWQSWSISGGNSTWAETWARERDALGWDLAADSQVHWNLTWPTTIASTYYKRSMSYQAKDAIHYITYYVYNQAPTTGYIEGQPTTYKDLSGEASIYKGFPTTFVATDFFDKDGDSITYEWVVDGTRQSATSQSLKYTFAIAGSHTIKVRAKDSLSAYSAYAKKTIATVLYTSYAGWSYGQCTYYAALEFDKAGYDGVRATGPGMDWHSYPITWVVDANASGWVTTTNGTAPEKGAIIAWSGGKYGHVGVVLAVYDDGIKIGEMNWPLGAGITFSRLNFTNLDRGYLVFIGYIYPWKY